MNHTLDNEIDVVRTIVSTLEPLEPEKRQRVLMFALGQLGITRVSLPIIEVEQSSANSDAKPLELPETIRSLKKKKLPTYATEMAAIVAYYLAEVAPPETRKSYIGNDDIRTYFRKADFKLPKSVPDILIHATQSGYFESRGDGRYELTPVGRDLVVNKLPKNANKKSIELQLA